MGDIHEKLACPAQTVRVSLEQENDAEALAEEFRDSGPENGSDRRELAVGKKYSSL